MIRKHREAGFLRASKFVTQIELLYKEFDRQVFKQAS